jgi:UDP:flavonoid glycosyltransferase YjiC (YdhE family)
VDLLSFLDDGPIPVYIGFGSIIVDDPKALTTLIFEAIKLAGVRAIVGRGWADLGGSTLPQNVFMVDNCPHDWLFKHVSCVVHHGGAGTTAAGVAAGKPTVVVPFFGDQPFWGSMVARAGAGPQPVPSKMLTASNLAAAISASLDPNMSRNALKLAAKIKDEKGAETAVKIFTID